MDVNPELQGGRRARARRSFSAALVASCVLVSAAVAHAHPDLEAAERAYREADFEAALEALERAEASERLTRDELKRLLVRRAVILSARSDDEALHRALTQLLVVDPDARFGEEVAPRLRAQLEEMRAERPQPEVNVALELRGPTVRLVGSVGDHAGLARSVRVGARASGGPWVESRNELALDALPGATIEYYAAAIGPGGVVVGELGSRNDPRRHSFTGAPETEGASAASVPIAAREDEADPTPWIVIGTVGGLLAAAAIVVAVVLAAPSDPDTQLLPRFELDMP
jgi:hypothetical protein